MECPHCRKRLEIGSIPELNMERYGRQVLAATQCCGRGVVCTPYLSFRAEKYTGEDEEDGWGTPFKTE